MPTVPAIATPPSPSSEAEAQVREWTASGEIIDDNVAKAIGQLYHGPRWPATTHLGQGTSCDAFELTEEIVRCHIPGQTEDDGDLLGRPALRALIAWIADRAVAPAA